MDIYSHEQFKSKVNRALEAVQKVLENNRHPQVASEVPHRYTDKYLLAEFLTNTTISSILNCFEAIGLTKEQLKTLVQWSKTRSVTIRFESRETCEFLRKTEREVESPVSHVTEVSVGSKKSKVTSKVLTKITEYFYSYKVHHQVFFYQGSNPNKETRLEFQSHTGHTELVTTTDRSPKSSARAPVIQESPLTWLLKYISSPDYLEASFSINRDSQKCRTPRRNPEIQSAVEFLRRFTSWIDQINQYFRNEIFPSKKHSLDLSIITREHFVPVLPLLEERHFSSQSAHSIEQQSLVPLQFQTIAADQSSTVLPFPDLVSLLNEQRRQLIEKLQSLTELFPGADDRENSLISVVEIKFLATLHHARTICDHFQSSLDLIEQMLRDQLVSALGKEVQPRDFDQYMTFHFRKNFRSEFAPRAFSYAIRRPDHSPEGELSIEAMSGDSSIPQPISTIVRHSIAKRPMYFQLNASTRVGFLGDRYVHGWIAHQFEQQQTVNQLELVARARQFSSFILLVGTIANEDTFLPQSGLIVQNKDDLRIPLNLEQIPSAKEFRDAIESLSPEQQAFAKAFRSMQLAGSVFALCVLQIKPQLERVLNLPPDSLTKEIQLSQDLLGFFQEYQIPSDLLSYGGNEEQAKIHTAEEKLAAVKAHAEAMSKMIADSKQKELDDQRMKAEMARASIPAPPPVQRCAPVAVCAPSPPGCGGSGGRGRGVLMSAAVPERACAPPPPPAAASPAPVQNFLPPPPPPSVESSLSVPEPPPEAFSEPSPVEEEQIYEKDAVVGDGALCLEASEDYSKLPASLDKRLLELDEDAAVKATIVKPAPEWKRKAQKGLLSGPAKEFSPLGKELQRKEKNSAFDLLDALSRSGALAFEDASLHVMLASTHCFDKSIINTLVQDNVNPISKVERSALIISSVIHQESPEDLIRPDQISRVSFELPRLFQ